MTHYMGDDVAARLYDLAYRGLLGLVLDSARRGALHIHWRDRLDSHPYVAAAARRGPLPDRLKLAIAALAELPVQTWEPFAAATRREALDAWYQASCALENNAGPPPDRLVTIPGGDGLIPPPPRPSLETVLAADLAAAENRRRQIDVLGASYRIGLMWCGDQLDWAEWMRARVAEWDDHDGRIDPHTTESLRNDARRQYGTPGHYWGMALILPAYWAAIDAWRE